MTHHRLRKFNTKKTYPEQKLDNDLCMSVRASGTHVFLRGQVGQDLEGRIVGAGDPAAQAEQAMKNVKALLEEQGAELGDICKITVYITDRAYREPVYRVVGKWLKGVFPVSTGLIVQGLARPEWVMEIDAWAVIPDQRAKKRSAASTARRMRRISQTRSTKRRT
jgi:enamine deaminase RidA (YjgF/YER057c/UK114 family)